MEVSTRNEFAGKGIKRNRVQGFASTVSSLIFLALCLGHLTALAQPSVQSSGIVPIAVPAATSLRFDWTSGNGGNRIVLIGTIDGVYTPVNGVPAPTPNLSFTAAPDLDGGAGNVRCVVNGNVSTATVTNLTANTPYWIRIYEYSGASATPTYSFVANTTNPIFFQSVTTVGANTFTVPGNVSSVSVRAWGGGGGGGGANEGGGERQGGGGGGGAFQFNSAIAVAGSVTVTIGGGGAAGSGGSGDPPGDPGTATTFGGFLTANPGLGGTTGVSGTPLGTGGAGGAGVGAIVGGAGQNGLGAANGGRGGGGAGDTNPGQSGALGGAGGTNGGGSGGGAITVGNNGLPGTSPGGGGSGGWENAGSGNVTGGVGARGQSIISWTNPIPTITISGSSTTIGLPVFQVVFSKPIVAASFIPADVTLSGTATGTLTAAIAEIAPNDGTTFTMTVSGMTGSGTVIASLAADVVPDANGNTSLASNTGTTITYTHIITGATVNPNAGNVIIGQPVVVTLTAAGAQTGLLVGAGSTINGVSVTGSFAEIGGGSYTYTYTPSAGDPTWALNSLPISLRLSDGTNTSPPRISFTGGSASATDLTRPTVNSNTVGTITPTGFTFTINLSEAGTTHWEVTTSATPPTPAQVIAGTGTGHVSNGNFAVAAPATPVNQAIGSLSSATLYYIYSVSTDAVGNQTTPVTTNNLTTLCAPPTAQPTAAGSPFTSVTAAGMTVNWVRGDGTGGVIVVARQGSAVSFAPTSGSTYAGQINANFPTATDQGSGNRIVYRGSGTSVAVTGLTASTTYHFAVYEYNTANDCYLTTSPLIQNQATLGLANEATLSNGAGTATISSLVITPGAAVAVFTFDVTDAGADGVPTLISSMAFQPGTGNDFGNFTHLIPATGAQLFDDDGNGPAGTLAVASGSITFTAIPNGAGQLGIVDNGTSKTYTLRIHLNNPLNAAIRATADLDNLVLQLANTNVTTAGGGSGMAASSVNSGPATSGAIQVVADRLAFIQQPSNTLIGVAMTPAVTLEATDIMGARDEEFVSTVGVTSTGTLTGSPVDATYVLGVGTYSTLTHTATAAARTLTTNSGLVNPTSSTFNLTASNESNIIVDPGFVYQTDIAYDTYQEAVNITNSGTSLEVGRFIIQDGGNDLTDADVAPTIVNSITLTFANFAVLRRVELYDATGTVPIPGTEQLVSSANITFGGLSLTANDNSSTAFTVRVSFRSLVTDNAQFSVAVNTPTTTTANISSTLPAPAGAITSTAGNNNRIEVDAAQFRFIQQPTSSDVNATMAPDVTVEAVDAFNNRDVDYVGTVDMISTGSLTVSPQTETFVAGVGTYNTIVHNVSGSGLTLATNDGTLTNATSSTFQIVALSSNITTSAFAYPNNIPYHLHQEAANIANSLSSLVVASFDISDGGLAFPDGDLAPTVLTNLTLDLGSNYTFIRRIALYDATGTSEILGTEQLVGSQTVNFGGLSLTAPDNGTFTFTVRVSFNALVVDRQQFSFTVTSATSQAGNSRFATGNAGGATTSVAGDDNKVQVTGTRMLFATHPVNTLNGVTMANVVVHAVDGPGSIDIDFGMSVGLTSNGVMPISPQFATFVSGIGTYSSIVHSANGTGLALTTNSILANVVSNTFNITSSALSDVFANAAFPYPTNIAYHTIQENFNLSSVNSLEVGRFDVRDGAGAADPDLAPTVLTAFTLNLGSNFGFIRRIALYDAAGTTEILGTDQPVGGQFINFSGLSITAPDGGSTSFTVRVSFTAAVVDNQQFSLTMTAPVTASASTSAFATANAGGATTLLTGDRNRIEVTATQIRFATNLSSPLLAGINVSSQQATPVVQTTDGLLNIDRDYGTTLNLSCAIPTTSTTLAVDVAPPNGGVYTFPAGFQYTPQTGNGQLTISIGGLTSAVSNPVTVQAGTGTEIVAGALAPATISSLTNASPGVKIGRAHV